MKLTVSLEECKNPSFPLSPPHQFHSEFVTREIGFADKRSKLKAVDGTRKLHFIRSKQTSLTIPAAQGEGGLEGGGRGKEGAKPHRIQSATDRKIKEHDAVGSRARGIVLRDAKGRTENGLRRQEKSIRSHACITCQLFRRDCEVLREGKLVRNYLPRLRP